jgi:hypothetical protein
VLRELLILGLRATSSRLKILVRSGGVIGRCYVEDVVRTMAQALLIVLGEVRKYDLGVREYSYMLVSSCILRRK